jgi:hypothetical protein
MKHYIKIEKLKTDNRFNVEIFHEIVGDKWTAGSYMTLNAGELMSLAQGIERVVSGEDNEIELRNLGI